MFLNVLICQHHSSAFIENMKKIHRLLNQTPFFSLRPLRFLCILCVAYFGLYWTKVNGTIVKTVKCAIFRCMASLLPGSLGLFIYLLDHSYVSSMALRPVSQYSLRNLARMLLCAVAPSEPVRSRSSINTASSSILASCKMTPLGETIRL
jgi:hypothetical protein